MVRTLRVKVQILLLVIKMVNAEKKQGYFKISDHAAIVLKYLR